MRLEKMNGFSSDTECPGDLDSVFTSQMLSERLKMNFINTL